VIVGVCVIVGVRVIVGRGVNVGLAVSVGLDVIVGLGIEVRVFSNAFSITSGEGLQLASIRNKTVMINILFMAFPFHNGIILN